MTDSPRDIRADLPPTPPPAPEIVPEQEPADGSEASIASEARVHAADSPKGKRRGVSRSTIVAIVAALVVVLGVYGAMLAMDVAQSRPADTRLSDSSSGASGQSSNKDDATEKEAKADIRNSLDSLSSDEDGQFRACVESFIEAYDAGVAEESYTFADLGVTADDLSPRLRSELEFSIARIDVYNGTAWVDVDVSSKSISAAVETFSRSVAGAALECSDEQEYLAALKEALLDAFDRQEPRTTRVLLTVAQADGAWVLSDENKAALFGAAWSA